jgi:hypothetical protein
MHDSLGVTCHTTQYPFLQLWTSLAQVLLVVIVPLSAKMELPLTCNR